MFKSITDIPDRTKAEKLDAAFAAILNDRKLRIKINVLKTARNFGCRYESLRDPFDRFESSESIECFLLKRPSSSDLPRAYYSSCECFYSYTKNL